MFDTNHLSFDLDGDGAPDALNVDLDGDGMADGLGADFDGDGHFDAVLVDQHRRRQSRHGLFRQRRRQLL